MKWFSDVRPLFPPPPDINDISDINDIIDITAVGAHLPCTMASLLIRGLDDKLKRQLRLRAAENGRSMEEEVRRILRIALDVPSPEDEAYKKMEELAAKVIQDRQRRGS